MALPNTNISVAMVKAELGAATNDVGQLCIHPNINKWSKWKPVRLNKLTGVTELDIISTEYGLVIDEERDDMGSVDGWLNWHHDKPGGGLVNEFYRLGDFRNYNHNAGPKYVFDLKKTSFNLPDDRNISINLLSSNYEIDLSALTVGFDEDDNPILVSQLKPMLRVKRFTSPIDFDIVATFTASQSLSDSTTFVADINSLPEGNFVFEMVLVYEDRVFAFPDSPEYPNHKNVSISKVVAFTLEDLSAEIYSSTWATSLIMGTTVNEVISDVEYISIDVNIRNLTGATIEVSKDFTLSVTGDPFNTNETVYQNNYTVYNGASQDSTKLILPPNSYANLQIVQGVNYIPANVDYGPYDGNLLIKYRGDTVLNNGFKYSVVEALGQD